SAAGARVFGLALVDMAQARRSSRLWWSIAEYRGSDPYDGSAFGDGDLEIVRHAHRKIGERRSASVKGLQGTKAREKRPTGRRVVRIRRHRHEPAELERGNGAHGVDD